MILKKKIISLLLASSMIMSSTTLAYNDIDDHWAKPYITNMKNAEVLGQFKEDQIYPDKPMSRAECSELISDFLETYYKYKPPYDSSNYKFNDLVDGTASTNKIRALSRLTYRSYMTGDPELYPNTIKSKIIEGYPTIDFDNPFKPEYLVTRAEFAKMLMCAIDCLGYMSVGNYAQSASDADLHWGRHFLMLAYGYGVMNGYQTLYGDYTMYLEFENRIWEYPVEMYIELQPDGHITRAEAIKMVASARGFRYVGLEYSQGTTRPNGESILYYLED